MVNSGRGEEKPVVYPEELRSSFWGAVMYKLYLVSFFQKFCVRAVLFFEGGPFFSGTLRRILRDYHGVDVGAYSYGECLIPRAFPRGVTVGRYVSIASAVQIFLRDHPSDRLSTHPFFFNSRLGFLNKDSVESGKLYIGHDAWVGARVTITNGCSRIGIGAVIGAGAVVTKDVPDFAVFAGNPARLIKFRFPKKICKLLVESIWWERPCHECVEVMEHMVKPLGSDLTNHPLLSDFPSKGKSF